MDSARHRRHKAQQLRRRVAARYQTTTVSFQLGPLQLPFIRVANPDTVLDEVAAAIDLSERLTGSRDNAPQHLPYWAELWDSAIGMATFLASDELEIKIAPQMRVRTGGKLASLAAQSGRWDREAAEPSVLDLGCGMGLSGTVAAALGARVMFADLESAALLFARLNTLRYAGRIRARQLNWQTDNLHELFDVILGADILYERSQWEYLEPFWRSHLKDGGTVLLGEPGRPTGDNFPQWILPRGWDLVTHEQRLPTRDKPIRLFAIRKNF